jgi:GNAT superfamily N-acetyltransferase
MHESVRVASEADISALDWLQDMARHSIADLRGGAALLAEQPSTDWAVTLADPLVVVIVATIDDVVLGYLELRLTPPVATVRQVFVHDEAREVGLGDSMMGCAIDQTVASGCDTIEGHALPGDRNTKNLYERAGIVARKIIVSKLVGR